MDSLFLRRKGIAWEMIWIAQMGFLRMVVKIEGEGARRESIVSIVQAGGAVPVGKCVRFDVGVG